MLLQAHLGPTRLMIPRLELPTVTATKCIKDPACLRSCWVLFISAPQWPLKCVCGVSPRECSNSLESSTEFRHLLFISVTFIHLFELIKNKKSAGHEAPECWCISQCGTTTRAFLYRASIHPVWARPFSSLATPGLPSRGVWGSSFPKNNQHLRQFTKSLWLLPELPVHSLRDPWFVDKRAWRGFIWKVFVL